MRKHRIERNLAFPTEQFRARVRAAAKERGFRSEQAFILTACENEVRRGDNTEATTQLEAKVAATLAKYDEGGPGALHFGTRASCSHKFALAVRPITCMIEPPEEMLPATRARARLRYARILRLAGQEVATRNKATLEEALTHGKQQ